VGLGGIGIPGYAALVTMAANAVLESCGTGVQRYSATKFSGPTTMETLAPLLALHCTVSSWRQQMIMSPVATS
jgi:hypothetical protein